MKQFIKHLFSILIIFWALAIIITVCIYTFIKKDFYKYYELPDVVSTQKVYANDKDTINTIFIGSSLTYRQLDPLLFDSVTHNSSFSLAYAGLFPYRSLDALNEALKTQKARQLKNVFIELAAPDPINSNFNNNPYIYSTDFRKYRAAISTAISSSNLSTKVKGDIVLYWSACLAYKYSGFSISKYLALAMHINESLIADNNKYEDLISKTKGFVDLNTQEAMLDQGKITKERQKFQQDGQNIMEDVKEKYLHLKAPAEQKDLVTEYILNCAKRLREQNINVFFIIAPRKLLFARYALGQKEVLEKNGFRVFDLSNPHLFPDFYKLEYSYEKTHMNAQGARLYTLTLANLVNQNK